MSAALPDLIDPLRAVDTEAAYVGSMPLERFPRLREVLVDSDGDVRYDLRFRRDDDGCPTAVGSVHAVLALECQRCLEPIRHAVDAEIAVALVRGLDEARELPEYYDPLVLEERLIGSRDLLEDELLLGIPQVPMHPEDQCVARGHGAGSLPFESVDDVQAATNNPFAVLADSKRNNKP